MRNGLCPKCGAATVYWQHGGVGEPYIHVRTSMISKPVPFISFVCATCGYFETYINDAAKLADVAAKWNKVPAQP